MRSKRSVWLSTIGTVILLVVVSLGASFLWRSPGVMAQQATATPTGTRTMTGTPTEEETPEETPEATVTPTEETPEVTVTPTEEMTPTTILTPTFPYEGEAVLPRTITVIGQGSVTVEPDIARATIGVETVGDTVREAIDEAGETMDAVIDALQEGGIEERDIQTTGFSVFSERDFGPEGTAEDTVRYRVSNNVTVTVRDLDGLGNVLDAAVEAGANNIFGVNFALDDPEAFTADARREAVANALAKARELAELNGVELATVIGVSEVIGAGPTPFALAQEAAADGLGGAGPFVPGQLEVTVRLQVMYAIRSTE